MAGMADGGYETWQQWYKRGCRDMGLAPEIQGFVAPGWERVKEQAELNFSARCEQCFSCCVHHRCVKVVDIWGGMSRPGLEAPEEFISIMFSCGKGLAAFALLVLHSRGLMDWEAPVAKYWPAFGSKGKDTITCFQLFAHQAGVGAPERTLTVNDLADWRVVGDALCDITPEWRAGENIGYMGVVVGFYIDQLVRHVDPKGRGVVELIQEDICPAIGVLNQYQCGLPPPNEFDRKFIAPLCGPSPMEMFYYGMVQERAQKAAFAAMLCAPRHAYSNRVFSRTSVSGDTNVMNSDEWLSVGMCSVNALSNGRFVATLYDSFNKAYYKKGNPLQYTQATIDDMLKQVPPPTKGLCDVVLHQEMLWSHGFYRPSGLNFGSSTKCFGFGGAGGQYGHCDPDAEIAYGYTTPRLDCFIFMDPRELFLRKAVYETVRKTGYKAREQWPDPCLAQFDPYPDVLFYNETWGGFWKRQFFACLCPWKENNSNDSAGLFDPLPDV